MKYKIVLAIVTFIIFSTIQSQSRILVKANVVRGESFVTVRSNPKEIESKVEKALKMNGYEIAQSIFEEDLILCDLFIYQHPAAHPSVSIICRSKNGVIYFDSEKIKLFGDRHEANLKIIDKLLTRFPIELNLNQVYSLSVKDILSNNRISLIGLTSNSITKSYRSSYDNVLVVPENEYLEFVVPNGFIEYLQYCSSFTGFRKYLKREPMKVILKINEIGRFEILDIDANFEMKDKYERQINDLVDAMPIWRVKKEIEPIELILSFK